MLNLRNAQRGMSVIEVMIAVTLAALLLAMGVPAFIKGAQSRQIRTAADGIQSGLQVAKTEALRRNRNVKFQLRNDSGWTVGCDPVDASLISGEPACPAEIQKREALEGSANARTATSEVVAATGSGAGTAVFTDALTFTPLGRVAATTLGAGNNAIFQVTNPSGGTCAAAGGDMRCLNIIVSSGGQIRMCDPAVAAGDPRAC
jgi:type IV fimbrial biogenesis protein FimT